MVKADLPVILLKGIVLLPNNELRLEFDNEESKNIIDLSELFHENHILVVSSSDPLEESPDKKELPKIGIISEITRKIELPNGNVRVVIKGIERAEVFEYLNLNKRDVLEAIVSSLEVEEIDEKTETAMVRKLYRELETYIKRVPYMSNSILASVDSVKSLSVMTDLIVPHLPVGLERLLQYLNEQDILKRTEMILEDIYEEQELFDIERQIDQKVKKRIDNSQKDYLLHEKMNVIKEELGEHSLKEDEVSVLRKRLEELDAPEKIKTRIEKEIRYYDSMPAMSPEVTMVRTYIDWLLDLPWNIETEDNHDLKEVKDELNASHYGLEKVKTRIIEYLAVKERTNNLRSPIICLVGPPGVGKTSLAVSIAHAINRNFVKISVGGVSDEADIFGHRRTYVGANPGRIISSLKKAKSRNPVFLIDEIDKMRQDIKGDPSSALLEVLDPEQNEFFMDHYMEEEFDLSKVMFVATANYIENIPAPLLDRLEIIELSSYTEFEKIDIAKKHLIPKICKEHGIEDGIINFSEEAILSIIRYYTKEAGVRELERQLSNIVRKIVTSLVLNNIKIGHLNITGRNIHKYLGKKKYASAALENDYQIGVVTGLAYTTFGGDTLSIEVNHYDGSGQLVLTGSLGDVMKESAKIALSYIKANHRYFKIGYSLLNTRDIHIHVPEGAIPKDGPSAGITLTTALISALTEQQVDKNIAMTGEITLRGTVLPIGGLKEKSIGAHRNGIKKIIIPYDNLKDLDEIPSEVKDDITFIPVKTYKEVWNIVFKEKMKSGNHEQEQLLL
ncbi:MAG: endopeptidase La [Bacilli bacterium]|nr:endopeptidase La [Bacilli bacterium]